MLNSISWEQYGVVIASLLFIYYLGILFFYYRKDLINKLSAGKYTSSNKVTEPKYFNPFSTGTSGLMGSVNQEEAEGKIHVKHKETGEAERVEVGAITTEDLEEAEPPLPSPETLLLGSIADLLKEAKILIQLLSENEGSLEDFKKLISALLAKNSHLKSTTYKDAISIFIFNESIEKFQFEISMEEVKELWN